MNDLSLPGRFGGSRREYPTCARRTPEFGERRDFG